MYIYSVQQWLLFFYFYCFCGWIWECLYVSIRMRKWQNRGFLHGPLLPIYGFGAVVVLFLTLPVRNNLWLVGILGMIGSTVLEYVTGAVMEKMFHMRYWDYTGKPFNINGYICLFCSVGWGLFSVALVGYVHCIVEKIILLIPAYITDVAALVITIIAVIDVTQSFNAAMDLREMIERATENSEKLRTLEKRIDVVAAVVDDDIKQLREKSSKRFRDLEQYVKNPKLITKSFDRRRFKRMIRIVKGNPDANSREFTEALSDVKNIILNKIKK